MTSKISDEIRNELASGLIPDKPAFQFPTAYDLLTAQHPDPVWAIPGVLPVGLAILGGRPKLGKSWLSMQIALAVAAGGNALGFQVEKGKVLYLALEDNKRRFQERMQMQGWPVDQNLPVNILVMDEFRKYIGFLHKNGWVKLRAFIEAEQYRYVVVDTLSRAFLGVKDINDSQEVTAALSPLQETALTTNTCMQINDHHTKPKGSDPNPIDDLLGSTAKAGVADTLMGLYRERGQPHYKLMITGRDVAETTFSLKWDRLTWCWQVVEDKDTQVTQTFKQAVAAYLNDTGQPIKLYPLARALSKDPGNLYRVLQDLIAEGLIGISDDKEYYAI